MAGFTLIELMVGVVVGLLATLVISNVLSYSEGQRRSSTSGSDAQVSGGLAIHELQRSLKMAGYGLSTEGRTLGCQLQARYKGGAAPASMPPTLAPVIITAGAGGAPDSLRILSSSKPTFSLPVSVTGAYDPDVPANANRFLVATTIGAGQGDLMALVYGANQACQIFQVSAAPAVAGRIDRLDAGDWNDVKFPSTALAANSGTYLVNLGALNDVTYSLTADFRLRQTSAQLATQNSMTRDLQSNIVALRAFYGKDTDGDDAVDTFDAVTPVNNAGWLQVRAIRVAVLARSGQFEKEEVTTALPQWDVGSFASVTGSVTCGGSKCIELKADVTDDWKHYRYKVFDMLVPLRNQIWRADFVAGTASAASAP
jgi:type IV pilus assembly protein PilW